MYLKESDMPGPSDDAKALQFNQHVARDAMYRALNDVREDNPGFTNQEAREHPLYLAAKQAYDRTVEQLLTLLGPDVQCFMVDTDLWQEYSDWFKDAYGHRPFGARITRDEVRQQFDGLAMAA
jgi:hypothetical protein